MLRLFSYVTNHKTSEIFKIIFIPFNLYLP